MFTRLALLAVSLLPFVNPLIGTRGTGNASPAASYPFGMMQLGPEKVSDSLILGFTHLDGSGLGKTSDLLVMPATGLSDTTSCTAYTSAYSNENASPGYYSVYLEKPGVLARMTVGRRAGMHEYTFRQDDEPCLIIDLRNGDKLVESGIYRDKSNPYVIWGRKISAPETGAQEFCFYMKFSRPIVSSRIDSTGAVLHFKPARNNVVGVRIGISSVSCQNAAENFLEENIESFESLKNYTEDEWNCFLGTVDCPFEDENRKTIFYTSLYRCGTRPSLYNDINGEYWCRDKNIWTTVLFDRYTVTSPPEMSRGFYPLIRKLSPEMDAEFICSMLAIFKEDGKLPRHCAPVIADAVAAGVQGFPPIDALAALVESSVADEPGLISFRENGCVIEDDGAESVAGTLEYAYDDWCIAQIARTLMAAIKEGNTRQALENIYDRFMASAQNWRNVFDPKTGTLRSRRNGQWGASSPAVFVPHDIMGLMRAMGGPTAFRARLDSLTKDIKGFPESMQYIPGLYALAGRQDVCDTLVERLMGECFRNAPDGLDGSDEFGQMSAWYVLNALGEYSLCPGSSGPQKTWVAKTIVVNPVFVMESDVVVDSLQVGIGNIDVGCKAWYTIDGGEAIPYEGPFEITGPCMLECWAENQAGLRSFINKCQIYGVQ